jgi:hypothetical protein
MVANKAVTTRVLGVSFAKTGFCAVGGAGAGGGEKGFLGRWEGVFDGNELDGKTMSCNTIKGIGDVPFEHDITHLKMSGGWKGSFGTSIVVIRAIN